MGQQICFSTEQNSKPTKNKSVSEPKPQITKLYKIVY